MTHKLSVVCFGEILWDVFPESKTIGGAPLNVALRLRSLGVETAMISCVGRDDLGEAAIRYIQKHKVNTDFIASHRELITGEVLVTLDESGSARYTILEPVAWDAIPPAPEIVEVVKKTLYFIFGSLAVRNAFNRNTLQILLSESNTKIFDVNLRAPHYDLSMIYELMQLANVIKLNDEELVEICDGLGCQEEEIEAQLHWLERVTQTSTICVTKGPNGASLLYNKKIYHNPGIVVEVADTVGAGDSFLAVLIDSLFLKKNNAETALQRACAMGAMVASKSGANCEVTSQEISSLLNL